jgi:hypothetical protein
MKKQLTIRNSTAEFLIFTSQAGEDGIEVRVADENVWLTQKLIAKLFDVHVATINEHLKNIFATNELDEKSVVRKFLKTASDGKNYNTKHYNLEIVIALGYKINSERATNFRRWATRILKNAALNAAINKSSTYKLDNIYSSTSNQRSWMYTSKEIVFDTTLVQFYFNSLSIVDSFQTNSLTFVLASETKHRLNGKFVNINSIQQPTWVENIPRSNIYKYSVGISEAYYSDTESWENSEENARIELAKGNKIKSRQLQKKLDSQYTDIVNEIVEAK